MGLWMRKHLEFSNQYTRAVGLTAESLCVHSISSGRIIQLQLILSYGYLFIFFRSAVNGVLAKV